MPTSITMTEEVDIRWGTVKNHTKTKTFYSSFISEGVEYSLFDNVEVNNGSDGDADPYIGKIVKLWEVKEGGESKALIRWFFRPRDLGKEMEGDPRELYLAFGTGIGVTNENDLEVICGRCKVLCTSKDARNLQPSAKDLENADFFFSKIYNVDLQHVSPIQRVVDKIGCEVVYNKPEWVTGAPKKKENAVEQCNSLQALKRKAQCMGDSPSEVKDKQIGTEVVNDTQQRVYQKPDLTKQQVTNMNKVTQNKKLKTTATQSPPKKVATANRLQSSEKTSLGEVIASKILTSGEFVGPSVKVEKEEPKKADLLMCAPVETNLNASDLEKPLSPVKPSTTETTWLKVDDDLEEQIARQLDEKGSVENVVVKETCIDIQTIRVEGQTRPLTLAMSSSDLLKGEQEKTSHEKIEMNISASGSKAKEEFEGAVQLDQKIGVSLERKGHEAKVDLSSSPEPKNVLKDTVVKEVRSNVSQKPLSSTGPVFEKKLFATTESVRITENWKIFKELPWEQNLQKGILSGRVLLLQNLDPCWTSADVRDMLKSVLKGVSNARIIPQGSLCPYAPALAIFDSKLLADSALQEIEHKCLVVGSSRRPIIACKFKENTNVSSFPGHLALERFKLGRNAAADEYKKAVSTSHCSQPNTIEYEMAIEWRRLQEIIETCRAELFERQGKEMEKIRKSHRS